MAIQFLINSDWVLTFKEMANYIKAISINKKHLIRLSIVLLPWNNSFAQKRIAVEITMGTNYSLNSYNPTEAVTTPVSKVGNKRYFSLNHQITAYYFLNSKISIGAGIGTQASPGAGSQKNTIPLPELAFLLVDVSSAMIYIIYNYQ